ncbi:endonuclease YncB(thermonuclease family) [Maribacter spongiicola]|uniref:Endonuclease YncB(Thermonuclease family) n=2 Tax=Maribacter spongiicola TaxID=1206753 RepID=A0A4R7JZH3_9FLAO|nr:endonuclease YncB(thermonuclease family) [Maribacter spongiicola]
MDRKMVDIPISLNAHYTMFQTICIIGISVFLASLLTHLLNPSTFPLQAKRKFGKVRYIHDGDTLYLYGLKPAIRLWGVDAPEVGEMGAQLATDALTKLTKEKRISYIPIDTDKYGRIVARVFLPNDNELNCMLIGQGVVKQYRKYSKGFYDSCEP